MRSQLPTLSPEPTMASGLAAGAATPHRSNAAYQVLIDSGPPTTLETPTPSQPAKRKRNVQTEPITQPALQNAGRPQQASQINYSTGLGSSIHSRPDSSATAALDSILNEVQRRQDAKRKVLTLVARSLDSIVASCQHELKDIAKEITGHFSTYLTATFLADPKARPDHAEPHLTDGRTVPVNWATVARSGHAQPQPRVNQQPQTNPTKGPAKAQPAEDLRILVRVPKEHQEWAKSLTNYALREATCKTLGLSLADIPDIHHTATGFAIRPRNKAIRQKVLAKEQEVGRRLKATKIELPTKWYNYVVPNCPTKLTNIFGEVVDIGTVIHDEVAAQTNLRPTSIRPSRHGPNPATDKGSWIVSFLEKVPPFRLFGTSAYSRLIEKKRPMPTRHNPGCQGYHSSRPCTRTPRCENCGKPDTGDGSHPQPCTEPERCANCFGPAPAGHSDCPAKPSRKNGKLKLPTAKELAAIRRAGQRLFANPQNRANDARVENTNRTSETRLRWCLAALRQAAVLLCKFHEVGGSPQAIK
ncbi:hypothetical protein ACJ41O_006654 [Fusarium nematophilum]